MQIDLKLMIFSILKSFKFKEYNFTDYSSPLFSQFKCFLQVLKYSPEWSQQSVPWKFRENH